MGPFDSTTSINSPSLLDGYISVQSAAEYSGYNIQYLRRMMQNGIIDGTKIGQLWLIRFASLRQYIAEAEQIDDRRFGPRSTQSQMNLQQ